MKLSLRRQFYAWMLLSVFVPMLLLTALHRHEPSAGASCTECVQHLPHAGHWSQAVHGVDNCLLCQLQALSYLPVGVASLSVLIPVFHTRISTRQTPIVLRLGAVCGLRAPPVKD